MAELVIEDGNDDWQQNNLVERILEALENNPLAPFRRVWFNGVLEPQSYDRKKALNHLNKGKTNSIRLETDEPFKLRASISRNPKRNVIVLGMGNKVLRELNVETLIEYGKTIANLLPHFHNLQIQTDVNLNEFYEEADLEWLPDCFGNFLDFYHLMSPVAYEPYYSCAELLAVPAHHVRELENVWIEIITYREPLSYDQPEIRKQIIKMTEYLNTHRLDRKQIVATV
jgi:hypothetical protein